MSIQGSLRGSSVDLSNVQPYVAEQWSEEIRRFRDQSLIASMYTKKLPFEGKRLDTLHIPNISRLSVNDKLPQTPVLLQARNESEFVMSITKYRESSVMIEDLAQIQSIVNLRQEYTREMAYALSRDLDNFVLGHRAVLNAYPSQRVFLTTSGGANITLGDGTANAHLTQAPIGMNYEAFLFAKQRLDEADVPQEGRVALLSPAQYVDLMAEIEISSRDYVPQEVVPRGYVGTVLGFSVVMTSQIGFNSLTGYVNGTGGTPQPTPGVLGSPYYPDQVAAVNTTNTTAGAATDLAQTGGLNARGLPVRAGANATAADGGQTLGDTTGNVWQSAMFCHNDWLALGIQQSVKTEMSRETLYLSDAVVSSHLYGAKGFRVDHGIVIHTAG